MMQYKIGDINKVTVTGIQPFGVFVINADGVSGLIHISECSTNFIDDINRKFKIGDTFEAVLMTVKEDKINYSIRALMERTGSLSITPVPVSIRVERKRHWTNYKDEIGFTALANKIPDWKQKKEYLQ